jgi:hypothetical protein
MRWDRKAFGAALILVGLWVMTQGRATAQTTTTDVVTTTAVPTTVATTTTTIPATCETTHDASVEQLCIIGHEASAGRAEVLLAGCLLVFLGAAAFGVRLWQG